MGWYGYGIYGGDGTQTRHIDFLKWAGFSYIDYDVNFDLLDCLCLKKTKLDSNMKYLLENNIDKVLKKMPKYPKTRLLDYNLEEWALEWQMLLALFLDAKLAPPKIVKENGIKASEVLMLYADYFDNPPRRKTVLRKFITKAKTVRAKRYKKE